MPPDGHCSRYAHQYHYDLCLAEVQGLLNILSSLLISQYLCTWSIFSVSCISLKSLLLPLCDIFWNEMSQTSRQSRNQKNTNQNRRRKLKQIFVHLMIAEWNNFIAANILLTKKLIPIYKAPNLEIISLFHWILMRTGHLPIIQLGICRPKAA